MREFPAILNFEWLFLRLDEFTCNYIVLPNLCGWEICVG